MKTLGGEPLVSPMLSLGRLWRVSLPSLFILHNLWLWILLTASLHCCWHISKMAQIAWFSGGWTSFSMSPSFQVLPCSGAVDTQVYCMKLGGGCFQSYGFRKNMCYAKIHSNIRRLCSLTHPTCPYVKLKNIKQTVMKPELWLLFSCYFHARPVSPCAQRCLVACL